VAADEAGRHQHLSHLPAVCRPIAAECREVLVRVFDVWISRR